MCCRIRAGGRGEDCCVYCMCVVCLVYASFLSIEFYISLIANQVVHNSEGFKVCLSKTYVFVVSVLLISILIGASLGSLRSFPPLACT